jgi:hypothetical protein
VCVFVGFLSDAFTGVVSEDKFKKDVKKSGVIGLLSFWETIFSHVKTVTSLLGGDHVVHMLAAALTTSLKNDEERLRVQRKVRFHCFGYNIGS